MKVFLSWSGKVSHDVASALRKWLPYMHHSIKPFISSDDIIRGDRWSGALTRELDGAECGIICITPFNAHKPWLNFEAGMLAKHMGPAKVMPLLFQVDQSALEHGPLAQFQTTDASRSEDFYSLISTLNGLLPPEAALDHDILRKNFEAWWPQLSEELRITLLSPGETRTPYHWLLTYEDLAIHNPDSKCTRIWFVTGDVFTYAVEEKAREELERNLKTVEYLLLIRKPENEEEREWTKDLDTLKGKSLNKLDYLALERSEFERDVATDYIMVESGAEGAAHRKVYVRIPIADGPTRYWFEADDRAKHLFYGRFDSLWAKSRAAKTASA